MICIVSCEHYPDDERIYHREIQTLVNNKIHITYFSRSESDIDLSDQFVSHINIRNQVSPLMPIKRIYCEFFQKIGQ